MLTQERLKEVLSYDPEAGTFVWKVNIGNRAALSKAGTDHGNGYTAIFVDKEKCFAHRLAFLYMEGYLPEYDVDHINGIRNDNRWCNLRHVVRSCNMQNSKTRSNNSSGYTGVSFNKNSNRWESHIMVSGKRSSLGLHKTALDAALARIAAEDCHPDFHCDERCENRIKVFSDLKGSPAE